MSISRSEALILLELEEGSSSQEIRTAYQQVYNELQIRINNAPTNHQRGMYVKQLKDVEQAHEVLLGVNLDDVSELPNISPVSPSGPTKRQTSGSKGLREEEALKLLDLQRPFTSVLLENANRKKTRDIELAIKSSTLEAAKETFRAGLTP